MEAEFPDHFGDTAAFSWPVTRADALAALKHFITECLPTFGDYQDAMKGGEPFLYHALLSPALNAGLLTAEEVCHAAERAFHDGAVPVHCAEGFIRQILAGGNTCAALLGANAGLPGYQCLEGRAPPPLVLLVRGNQQNCIRQVVDQTRSHAYATTSSG